MPPSKASEILQFRRTPKSSKPYQNLQKTSKVSPKPPEVSQSLLSFSEPPQATQSFSKPPKASKIIQWLSIVRQKPMSQFSQYIPMLPNALQSPQNIIKDSQSLLTLLLLTYMPPNYCLLMLNKTSNRMG